MRCSRIELHAHPLLPFLHQALIRVQVLHDQNTTGEIRTLLVPVNALRLQYSNTHTARSAGR